MRRSHLELYVEILNLLSQSGSLKLAHLMYKTNLNYTMIKKYVEFLAKQGLVEEQTVGNDRTLWAITQRGTGVIKYFPQQERNLPIVKEF